MARKKGPFYREVYRMLIKHSVIPVCLASVLVILAMIWLYRLSVTYSANRHLGEAAARLETGIAAYLDEVETLGEDPRLWEILGGGLAASAISEDLYAFTNSQDVRASFFLLDADAGYVLGSYTEVSAYLKASPPFHTGMLYRMQNDPGSTVLMLNDAGSGRVKSTLLSIGRAIVYEGETLGYFVFELDPEQTLDYIAGKGLGELVVCDDYYMTLMTSKNSFLDKYSHLRTAFRGAGGNVRDNGASYYVTRSEAGSTGLDVYVIVAQEPYRQALGTACLVAAVLLLVMLAVNLQATRKVAYAETQSIDRLLCDLRRMQEEGIYTPLAPPAGGGFNSLKEIYTKLLDEIRSLVQANEQEVLLRTTAEIKQLESQFNPHFIFNTLEVIRCLIKLNPADAERMILSFSELLRYSIDSSVQTVRLGDDLCYVDGYLSMVQLRRTIRLEYSIDLEPGTEDCVIPKLSIQPIVENAVKYVTDRQKHLHLAIAAVRSGGALLLRIEDDGAGIDPGQLRDMRRTLEQDALPGKYFGLYNVHRRIRLMYGRGYGLTLESAPGRGTAVTVKIPLHGRRSDD